MDYAETLPRLVDTEDVLSHALGHLSAHCRCQGDSLCVACELARDSWEESERLRELRARLNEFLATVDHTLRCIHAFTTGPEDAPVDCPVCAKLAVRAQEARRD